MVPWEYGRGYPRFVPKLKPQHCEYIAKMAGKRMQWLARLSRRLEAHRVPPDDPLMRAVQDAYNAMQALRVHSMYGAMPARGLGDDPEE
jgi:hypothetical protein